MPLHCLEYAQDLRERLALVSSAGEGAALAYIRGCALLVHFLENLQGALELQELSTGIDQSAVCDLLVRHALPLHCLEYL